jgi:hypothetical protein
MNDATRLLGGTLGVAVIGSVFAAIYANRMSDLLPAARPGRAAAAASDSVGGALAVAGEAAHGGHPALGAAIGEASRSAFFSAFHAGDLVAGGVAAAGALVAFALLPAHPKAAEEAAAPEGDAPAADAATPALSPPSPAR